ncbi:carboxypeptidase C prc1 [Podochytrium sp. JEL0797]|nr:carboxypeptidase C prc1 [Podochytrium sp. JEL0797]
MRTPLKPLDPLEPFFVTLPIDVREAIHPSFLQTSKAESSLAALLRQQPLRRRHSEPPRISERFRESLRREKPDASWLLADHTPSEDLSDLCLVHRARALLDHLGVLWADLKDSGGSAVPALAPAAEGEVGSHSAPSIIDPSIAESLKDDKVVNNQTLVPIIANLQLLISQELSRRETVLTSIRTLHSHLFNACTRLCLPFDSFINQRILPPTASIYTKRNVLQARVTEVDAIVESREVRLSGLREGVEEMRNALGDLTETEFVVNAPDDLSADTLDTWSSTLYALESEKSARVSRLARLSAKIHHASHQLNRFPSSSDQERVLFTFLQTPIPPLSVSNLPILPNTGRSPPDVPTSTTAYAMEQHYKSLLEHQHPTSPTHIPLTRIYIEWLESLLAELDKELLSRRERCRTLVKEIQLCLEELGEDEMDGLEVEDLGRVEEYALLAGDLRRRWRVAMQETVDKLLADLTILWDKCHIPAEQRTSFLAQFTPETLYSPLSIHPLTLELMSLQERYELESPIYRMIQQRTDLLSKMRDFEVSASDPKRLFRSSFQLVEEERFRKTCVPSLLKLEEELKRIVLVYEQDQDRRFVFQGVPFLAKLDQETASRFINESIFVFNTSTTTHPRGTITPGRQQHLTPAKKQPARVHVVESPRPRTPTMRPRTPIVDGTPARKLRSVSSAVAVGSNSAAGVGGVGLVRGRSFSHVGKARE